MTKPYQGRRMGPRREPLPTEQPKSAFTLDEATDLDRYFNPPTDDEWEAGEIAAVAFLAKVEAQEALASAEVARVMEDPDEEPLQFKLEAEFAHGTASDDDLPPPPQPAIPEPVEEAVAEPVTPPVELITEAEIAKHGTWRKVPRLPDETNLRRDWGRPSRVLHSLYPEIILPTWRRHSDWE